MAHYTRFVTSLPSFSRYHPLIADACQFRDKSQPMPVADDTVDDKPVPLLRDTGCSTYSGSPVITFPNDKLTGQEKRCILIDGTVSQTSVAEIHVDSPYFSGTTMAVCVDNPLYDFSLEMSRALQTNSLSRK